MLAKAASSMIRARSASRRRDYKDVDPGPIPGFYAALAILYFSCDDVGEAGADGRCNSKESGRTAGHRLAIRRGAGFLCSPHSPGNFNAVSTVGIAFHLRLISVRRVGGRDMDAGTPELSCGPERQSLMRRPRTEMQAPFMETSLILPPLKN
jgi:hypothetical protein